MSAWLRRWLGMLPVRHKLTLISDNWRRTLASESADLRSTAGIIAANAGAAVAFSDAEAARELLASLRATPQIVQACIYAVGDQGHPVLFAQYAPDNLLCEPLPAAEGLQRTADQLIAAAAIDQGGQRVGQVELHQSLASLNAAALAQSQFTLAILVGSLMVSLVIGAQMQRVLVRPLQKLAATAHQVRTSGDYGLRAEAAGSDEIGQLVIGFNDLLGHVAARETELQAARNILERQVAEKTRANRELESVLQRLRATQAQLIESERLASLGALVAGVAHEINTPVGVSVTAASTLSERVSEIRRLYAERQLARSALEGFLEECGLLGDMLLRNLQRAADLVHSFKQVAVDQSSGERRGFELKTYLNEVLQSLTPTLKKTGIKVQLVCPDGIQLDSYPGALAQIISNFINNSLLHAYPDNIDGTLRIVADADDAGISLRYCDDGCGIAPEHLPKVFDPFFTTKRNAGGNGLGLNIVHNLVTRLLGGSVTVHSEPGRGTQFTLHFPAVAPSATATAAA
jgi:signal transduction histidine kinase